MGIAAEKGKIYLLKTLPASLLREWGQTKFPLIVESLKEIQSTDSEAYLDTLKSNFNFRGIGQPGKKYALKILERIITARNNDQQVLPLNIPLMTLLETLISVFYIQFSPYCNVCANNVEPICPICEEPTLNPRKTSLVCGSCGREFDYNNAVDFKCQEGHTIILPELLTSLIFLPKIRLLESLANEINKVEMDNYDINCESFHIQGDHLHYFRQDTSVRYKLEDLEEFSSLPLLPDHDSQEYKALRKEIRKLPEKCQPAISNAMCQECIENSSNQICLMKIFNHVVPDYIPGAHHGFEFGDVSFTTNLFGHETFFLGMLKKYESGNATPRSSLGMDIFTQVINQYSNYKDSAILGVITPSKLDDRLIVRIDDQIRQYNAKYCVIGEESLIRILKKYKDET